MLSVMYVPIAHVANSNACNNNLIILNSSDVLHCRTIVPEQLVAANMYTENVQVWNF